jgi:hypothetical protein
MKEKKSLVSYFKVKQNWGQNMYAGLCNFNEGIGLGLHVLLKCVEESLGEYTWGKQIYMSE